MYTREPVRLAEAEVVLSHLRNQIGLELVQVHVQGPVETQGCGDGRNHLGNETVEVGERRGGNAEISATDVVNAT